MSTVTTGNIGSVVTNPNARKIIYGTYVIALVVIGALQVAFSAVQAGQPEWLTIALSVSAYLGVPIGGLALANASNKAAMTTTVTNVVAAPTPVAAPVTPDVAAAPVAPAE